VTNADLRRVRDRRLGAAKNCVRPCKACLQIVQSWTSSASSDDWPRRRSIRAVVNFQSFRCSAAGWSGGIWASVRGVEALGCYAVRVPHVRDHHPPPIRQPQRTIHHSLLSREPFPAMHATRDGDRAKRHPCPHLAQRDVPQLARHLLPAQGPAPSRNGRKRRATRRRARLGHWRAPDSRQPDRTSQSVPSLICRLLTAQPSITAAVRAKSGRPLLTEREAEVNGDPWPYDPRSRRRAPWAVGHLNIQRRPLGLDG
jgi:hypothetical protein